MIHAPRIVAARANLVPASVLCALALCALALAAVPAAAVSATGPQAAPSSTHAAAGNGRIIFSRGTGGDYLLAGGRAADVLRGGKGKDTERQ